MAYSGNEISYMDFTGRRVYNGYERYNYGSAAYEFDIERRRREEKKKELEEKRRRKQAALARRERRINIVKGIQLVAAAAVFFFGCVITITAVSSVAEVRYEIAELQDELSALQNENIVLASEISDTINLDYIENRAVNELGMSEPQSYQIKTISVQEQSYTVQYSDDTSDAPEVDAELLKEFFFKSSNKLTETE